VLDFGIAKGSLNVTDTQSGVLKGKVSYMAPEQCLGNRVDRRSDVFALGIVLWELTTVRRLFKGHNDFIIMNAVVSGKVPPPSKLRPDLPADVDAVIALALAKRLDDRYADAAAFARDLRAASAGSLDRDVHARARRAASHDVALDKTL